eukprot:scaffold45119_cov31-Tisochrysis_lutea.AAC.1
MCDRILVVDLGAPYWQPMGTVPANHPVNFAVSELLDAIAMVDESSRESCSTSPTRENTPSTAATLANMSSTDIRSACRAITAYATLGEPTCSNQPILLDDAAPASPIKAGAHVRNMPITSNDELDQLLLRASRLSSSIAEALRLSASMEQKTQLAAEQEEDPGNRIVFGEVDADASDVAERPFLPESMGISMRSLASSGESLPDSDTDFVALAEILVFGSAGGALRSLLRSRLIGAQQRLVRGSLAIVRDGPEAYGVSANVIGEMSGASELWGTACDGNAMPSAIVAAFVRLCDITVRAVADCRQRSAAQASAEELVPCICYSMATAVASDSAPDLVISLRLASAHLQQCGYNSREAYCITTIGVALSAIQSHGSRPATPPC